MTWVKICGTTNLADALAAVEAGADALGFVFAESMRRVTPETAAEICRHVPEGVEKIGVFTSGTPERIEEIAERVGLTAVQLHRPEDFRSTSDTEVIPVLHMSEKEQIELEGGELVFSDKITRLLLDSGNAQKGGGTGQRFDWARAQRFLKSFKLDQKFRIIVAGGLDPENVSDAIRVFKPFGVDVVSGVEREKGKKDPDKVRAFIAAAKVADNL